MDYGLIQLAAETASQMISFSGGVASVLDKEVKAKAEADAYQMKVEAQQRVTAFKDELRQSGDYTNYNERVKQFVSQLDGDFQSRSRNALTQRMARGITNNVALDMDAYVRDEVFQQMRDDVISQNQMTLNAQKDLYSGQQRIDEGMPIIDSMRNNGLISASQQRTMAASLATEAAVDEYQNVVYAAMPEAVENGDFGIIQKALDEHKPKYSVKIDSAHTDENGVPLKEDMSYFIDYDKVRGEVTKIAQERHKAEIVAMQKQNANDLSEYDNAMWQSGVTLAEQMQMARQGLRMVERDYAGHKLSEEDRLKYTDRWRRIIEMGEEAMNKAAGGGSSPEKLDSFQTFLKASLMPDTLMRDVQGGKVSLQQAKEVLDAETFREFIGKDWKETKGMSEREKLEWYEKNVGNYGRNHFLTTDVVQDLVSDRFPSLQQLNDTLVKELKESPDKFTPEAQTTLNAVLLDTVASAGAGADEEEMQKRLRNTMNAVLFSGAENAYRTKDKRLLAFKVGGGKEFGTDAKGLARGAQALLEEDEIFTDIDNNERWTSKQAKESAETIRANFAHILAGKLGINVNEIVQEWSYSKDDVGTAPVFRTKDNTYALELPGKDKDGEATGVRIVDKRGAVVWDSAKDEIPQTEEQAAIENRKNARAASDERYNTQAAYDERKLKRIPSTYMPSEVRELGVDSRQWDNATAAQRRAWLEEAGIDVVRFLEGR